MQSLIIKGLPKFIIGERSVRIGRDGAFTRLTRGTIEVVDIVQAFECGAIQNPASLRAQVEGCIMMGLGSALSEEIRFENGRVTNALFAD